MEEKLKQLGIEKAILIGIVLTFVYYFALYDNGDVLETSLLTNAAMVQQKTKELEVMQRTLADAKKHQEVAAKLGKDLEQVLSAVPQEYNSVELMKLISSEAKTVGLNILSLTGSEGLAADPGKNFVPIQVTVSLRGTFNQVMMFLSNLTKVGKVILTKNLTLTSAVSAGTSPSMGFSTTLEAYRYTETGGKKK